MSNQENNYFWHLVLSDNPVFLFVGQLKCETVDFCGLKVGDKVNRIGDTDRTGQAALNRMQEFKTHITYSGIFKEKVYQDSELLADMLLFELQEHERPIGIQEPCYIGYIIIQNEEQTELRVPDRKVNNPVYILRPYFGKIK